MSPSEPSQSTRTGKPIDPSKRAVRRPFRRRLALKVASLARWLHIYLSLFGLASVLFFSVTGITLNHPDWFFDETARQSQGEGKVETQWLRRTGPPLRNAEETDPFDGVARLEIVEHLRSRHDVKGALVDFRTEESECSVSFKGPGYSADAFIDRDSGTYTITQSYQGFIAVMNDLHKGRDTGPVWSAVIDISAVALTLISLSGLVLLAYLKLRRIPGTIVAVVGGLILLALAAYFVP